MSPEVTRIPHGLTAVAGLQTKVHPKPVKLILMPIENCFQPEYGLPPEVQEQYENVKRAAEERVAAAEAAIGLAILVVFFRNKGSIAVDDIAEMKG